MALAWGFWWRAALPPPISTVRPARHRSGRGIRGRGAGRSAGRERPTCRATWPRSSFGCRSRSRERLRPWARHFDCARPRAKRRAGAVALGDAVAVACAAGAAGVCYRVPVVAGLAPRAGYVFEVLAGALQEKDPAAAGVVGAFDTADSSDDVPPQVLVFSVALAGPCVTVRFSTSEPVTAEVIVRRDQGAGERVTEAGAGLTVFDLAVPLGGLQAGGLAKIVLRVTDRAGNQVESSAGAVDLPPATPPLAITEVLANPAGPSPARSTSSCATSGATVDRWPACASRTRRAATRCPPRRWRPAPTRWSCRRGYDPGSRRDVRAARRHARSCAVDTRLGSDGLSNGGEVVGCAAWHRGERGRLELRRLGRRLGRGAGRASACTGSSQTACDRPDAWNHTAARRRRRAAGPP